MGCTQSNPNSLFITTKGVTFVVMSLYNGSNHVEIPNHKTIKGIDFFLAFLSRMATIGTQMYTINNQSNPLVSVTITNFFNQVSKGGQNPKRGTSFPRSVLGDKPIIPSS
ncbi:hypothetical protein KP509_06G086300 [Ceratopteris richardii]|uniref:Uncharacterized protein n=1 Tax=Ceratopteris richardii TaxID=49495 RepID=A0A8T2UV62_CERRI|nr:hypothetical protein KP509_06G086300 [Ceratopteris richardii]